MFVLMMSVETQYSVLYGIYMRMQPLLATTFGSYKKLVSTWLLIY